MSKAWPRERIPSNQRVGVHEYLSTGFRSSPFRVQRASFPTIPAITGYASGCIRLEKPLDLAEYLMKNTPAWNRTALRAAIEAEKERTVPLPRPIAVHLLYWTPG